MIIVKLTDMPCLIDNPVYFKIISKTIDNTEISHYYIFIIKRIFHLI
jgi:hypothetical protein